MYGQKKEKENADTFDTAVQAMAERLTAARGGVDMMSLVSHSRAAICVWTLLGFVILLISTSRKHAPDSHATLAVQKLVTTTTTPRARGRRVGSRVRHRKMFGLGRED